jgi:hypothetical protein
MAEFCVNAHLEGETEVSYFGTPLKKRLKDAWSILKGKEIEVYAELEGETYVDIDPMDRW